MQSSAVNVARREENPRRVLLLLSIAELLAMSLWFTGTAVLPQVTVIWHASLSLGAWLTIAVQIGFALGAITFALFNVPDIFSPITVLIVSSLAAAAANAAFAFTAADPVPAIVWRGATGFFLAGVYPTGMKIIAGWFLRGRGLALGIMIGALTLGSALPHGVNSFGGISWKGVVLAGSGFAVLAAVIVALAVHQGPYASPQSRLDLSQIWEIARNRRSESHRLTTKASARRKAFSGSRRRPTGTTASPPQGSKPSITTMSKSRSRTA